MSSKIYFEKQDDAFQLCGQHALNNLLQGAYFTAFDLGDIGAKLDEEEQMLYNEFTKSIRKENCYRNVSLYGSFSIDVLIAALNILHLNAMSLSHPQCASVKDNLQTEQGFIINYNGHWMSYRKINNIWYNLNSITNYQFIDAQPVKISELYLHATLNKLYKNKFQIFVVRGTFPTESQNESAPKMEELKNEYTYYKSEHIKSHSILYKLSQQKCETYQHKQLLSKEKEKQNNYIFTEGFHIKWNIAPLDKINVNKILNAQNYLCATCQCRLVSNFLSKTSYLYCQYLGNFHCTKCHKKDKAIIPSKLLNTLYYKPLNVCVSAKEFLDNMYAMPCITMDMFNQDNKKIKKNKKLKKLNQILWQLNQSKQCILDGNHCKNGKELLNLNKNYIFNGLLSLNDIVNVLSVNSLNKFEILCNKLQKHIESECNVCKLKGDVCTICNDKENKMYTFQSDQFIECNQCNTKYHKQCWNFQCVKCH